MPEGTRRLALFMDFDNTITVGDVLDRVIERYSETEAWRECEARWQEGRMTSVECLSRQVEGLRVRPAELERFAASFGIDPHFTRIVRWAESNAVDLRILSDNFMPLIGAILANHGLANVPVFANELVFSGDRPSARFPWRDAACPRCAHCKGQHLRAARDRFRIYVGDGLSDICPSLEADVVFAKDSLADELERRHVAFRRFEALADVLGSVQALHGEPLAV